MAWRPVAILTGRRGVLLGALAALAVLGLVVALLVARPGGGKDGPEAGTSLQTLPPIVDGFPLPSSGTVTFGFAVLTLAGRSQPVTIRRVALDSTAVRLLGARVLGPDRPLYQFTHSPGFPSRDGVGSAPASGTRITQAPRGWELLLGLSGSGHHFLVSTGITVSYESGGRLYSQRFPVTIVMCPDRHLLHHGLCRPPKQYR